MVQAPARIPQNEFKCVGPTEDIQNIKAAVLDFLIDTKFGLLNNCIGRSDRKLANRFLDEVRNGNFDHQTMAEIKLECLKLTGSEVALSIDYLASALRTPKVAEASFRAASTALIDAYKKKAEIDATTFVRKSVTKRFDPNAGGSVI